MLFQNYSGLWKWNKTVFKKGSSHYLTLFFDINNTHKSLAMAQEWSITRRARLCWDMIPRGRSVSSFPSPVHPSARCTICHRPVCPPGSLRNAYLLPIAMDVWLAWLAGKGTGVFAVNEVQCKAASHSNLLPWKAGVWCQTNNWPHGRSGHQEGRIKRIGRWGGGTRSQNHSRCLHQQCPGKLGGAGGDLSQLGLGEPSARPLWRF